MARRCRPSVLKYDWVRKLFFVVWNNDFISACQRVKVYYFLGKAAVTYRCIFIRTSPVYKVFFVNCRITCWYEIISRATVHIYSRSLLAACKFRFQIIVLLLSNKKWHLGKSCSLRDVILPTGYRIPWNLILGTWRKFDSSTSGTLQRQVQRNLIHLALDPAASDFRKRLSKSNTSLQIRQQICKFEANQGTY